MTLVPKGKVAVLAEVGVGARAGAEVVVYVEKEVGAEVSLAAGRHPTLDHDTSREVHRGHGLAHGRRSVHAVAVFLQIGWK